MMRWVQVGHDSAWVVPWWSRWRQNLGAARSVLTAQPAPT